MVISVSYTHLDVYKRQVFDLGEGPLQRVPMLDPLRGTHALTAELLETSATASELLDALDR